MISFAQKDTDFLNKKKWGDIYFLQEKYILAMQSYNFALDIDPSCTECKKKISEAKTKIKAHVAILRKNYKENTPIITSNNDIKTTNLKPLFPEFVEINYAYKTDDSDLKSFLIGKYEVSQKEWDVYCKLNNLPFPHIPPSLKNDNYPIINISWIEAKKYTEWLSVVSNSTYDLPNKTEWELSKMSIKDFKNEAWLFENSQKTLHEVGKKQANAQGIYDIEGNVSEWIDDWFDKDFIEEKEMKVFFENNENLKNRIACGCSFKDELFLCKKNFNRSFDPEIKKDFIGFRLIKRKF